MRDLCDLMENGMDYRESYQEEDGILMSDDIQEQSFNSRTFGMAMTFGDMIAEEEATYETVEQSKHELSRLETIIGSKERLEMLIEEGKADYTAYVDRYSDEYVFSADDEKKEVYL